MNCENCQLFLSTGAISLSQLRTTYLPPTLPLCFKKIRKTTTTVFLFPTQQPRILTAVVQHSILNLSHPYFKFHVRLIDLSQSDIQILYGLQIDNVIRQCVNSSSVEFSRTS